MNIGELTATIGLDNKAFLASQAQANTSILGLATSLKKIAIPALAITGIIGLTKGLASATTAAANLEKSMANVATLVDKPKSEINLLTSAVQDMSTEVLKSSEDLSSGLYQVFSAGITDSSDALNVLRASAIAATAGISDTRTSVDAITSVLNAYNLQASDATHVSDLLFQTVRLGKTTYDELASSIGTVISVSATAGVKLEDLFSIISALTKGGVETRRATTAIRSLLLAVIKPSEEAVQVAKELGIQFDATAIKTKGLVNFLNELRDATGGNAETIAKLVPNARGLVAVMATLGAQNAELNRITKEFGDVAGSSAEALKKQANTINAQYDKIDLAIAKVQERLGKLLIPSDFLRFLQGLADILDRLGGGSQKTRLDDVVTQAKNLNKEIEFLKNQRAEAFLLGYTEIVKKYDEEIKRVSADYNILNTRWLTLTNSMDGSKRSQEELKKGMEGVRKEVENIISATDIFREKEPFKIFSETLPSVFNMAQEASKATAKSIDEDWDKTSENIKEAFKELGIVPSAQLESTLKESKNTFDTVVEYLENRGELSIDNATNITKKYIDNLKSALDQAKEGGVLIDDEQVREIENNLNRIAETATSTTEKVNTDAKNTADTTVIELRKTATEADDYLKKIGIDAMKAFKDAGIDINAEVVSEFDKMATDNTKRMGVLVGELKDYNQSFLDQSKVKYTENFDGFRDFTNKIEKEWKDTIEAMNASTRTFVPPSISTGAYLSKTPSFSNETNLTPFANGTNYVPRTMPAIVHKGEMIVPANQNPYNQDNRTFHNNFYMNNNDGDSFSQQQSLQRTIDKNRDMVSI